MKTSKDFDDLDEMIEFTGDQSAFEETVKHFFNFQQDTNFIEAICDEESELEDTVPENDVDNVEIEMNRDEVVDNNVLLKEVNQTSEEVISAFSEVGNWIENNIQSNV